MIAITPMPPTISAIDEMTTSARNVARLTWSQTSQRRVLRDDVEVVRLVERQPVPDAHDLLDLRASACSRGASSRGHDGDHARSAACCRRQSRSRSRVKTTWCVRLRNDDEVVLRRVSKLPADGPLAEDADRPCTRRRRSRTFLPIGSMPLAAEERLVRRLAEHDHAAAALDLGSG